jgi:hypothetical protein
MKLAMKGLSGIDRQIFRRVLEGTSASEIGRRLGVSPSTACKRVNGLLWTLRKRTDLAAYLDVDPAATTATRETSKPPVAKLAAG